ncbi:MAG: isoprenyl transferase [Alphaproteobacteria bacterium]|nr:MAG: isoprenyl transferase [Alphaproteobacteria bacterium]
MLSSNPRTTREPDPALLPIPTHVAIIMDGNGRWARQRGLPRVMGHRKGAEAVRTTVTACGELGIKYLTLYAFSSENWKRPRDEVDDLMGLLRHYLRNELNRLNKNNVRLRCIGRRDRLPRDIVDLIEESEAKTRDNTGLTLILALSYGAHAEIVEAARTIAEKAASGEIRPEDVDEKLFSSHLQTADFPDPDIIIRTSGEQRLSNFLLWQAAYAELLFLDDYWPDFTKEKLLAAIDNYRSRERRYGARSG